MLSVVICFVCSGISARNPGRYSYSHSTLAPPGKFGGLSLSNCNNYLDIGVTYIKYAHIYMFKSVIIFTLVCFRLIGFFSVRGKYLFRWLQSRQYTVQWSWFHWYSDMVCCRMRLLMPSSAIFWHPIAWHISPS